MKIDTENLEDHQVKLTVEVDSDQLEGAKRKAAKKIAKRIKVPGFRPGKAPYQVIQRQVGDEVLFEESLEIIINDIYPEVIEKAEIEPYGPGNLENVVSTEPLTLEFVVPLMAEVELSDYREYRFPYEPPEITDQDVNAVEEDFRQRQAVEESVDRQVEAGDHVTINLSAKRYEEDGESEDGNLIEERTTSVIIADEETDTPTEWPFDGFSRELVGMTSGEDKTLIYTYPEDSQFETLQDVTADFSVKVEDIKARILPELNDEFAQSLGEYDDLQALQENIRESLEQRSDEMYISEYDDQVLDAIIEGSTIKYPPQMLENELSNVIQQLESRLANQGLDMDIYLKTRDIDQQGLRDETIPVAETRVNRSLVLLEIARKEEIEISEDDLQQETERTLNSITSLMSDSDRKKFDTPNALMNLAGNIYAEMRMTRTLEYLRTVAKGDLEKETVSKEEVENGTDETITAEVETLAEDVQAEKKIEEHDELEVVQESEEVDENSEDEQLSVDEEEVKTEQENAAE